MKQFRVTITNGTYNAPDMYISADKDKAEEVARAASGLGRFDSWSFHTREIKDRNFKTKRS